MKERNLARTAGAVSGATLISRILGLAREIVLAKYFTAFQTDAFVAAFRIPNLLRNLFAEGTLSAAFVPTFTDYWQNKGKQEAWRLASILMNVLAILLSVLTLLMIFGAKLLAYFLVSGYAKVPGKIELTTQLTQVLSPFLLIITLAAVLMSILNSQGRFFIPALAPALFNLITVVGGVLLAPYMHRIGLDPVAGMAIATIAGALVHLFFQVPSLYKIGFRYTAELTWNHPGMTRMLKLMGPAFFGLAATQINILIDSQFASYQGNGPVSWLNYAFRLMQFPIGLFGAAIATVNLTNVSEKVASGNVEGAKAHLAEAVKLAAFWNIPATFGLIFLREPIVQILYERGRFLPEYTIETANALLFYSLGLYAYSLVKIVTPTFYALGNARTPVRTAAMVIAGKTLVNVALFRYTGFLGLAFATSLAATANALLLFRALNSSIGSLEKYGVRRTILKITTAGLVMGIFSFLAYHQLASWFGTEHLFQKVAALGITMAASVALFVFLCRLWNIEEVRSLLQHKARR